jgi:ribonuclease-3
VAGDDAAEALLGHRFADKGMLTEALTHRSAAGAKGAGSNERLEFIGDRVVGLIVAEWLLEKFPGEREGELGPRLAALVSRPALALVAETHGLAAALEALIGALYLDAGFEAARAFVRRVMADVVERQFVPPKDPKTALQEWALKRALPLPGYDVVEQSGPSHAPKFVIRAVVGDASAVGEAGSKRAAEQAAAQKLLELLSP